LKFIRQVHCNDNTECLVAPDKAHDDLAEGGHAASGEDGKCRVTGDAATGQIRARCLVAGATSDVIDGRS